MYVDIDARCGGSAPLLSSGVMTRAPPERPASSRYDSSYKTSQSHAPSRTEFYLGALFLFRTLTRKAALQRPERAHDLPIARSCQLNELGEFVARTSAIWTPPLAPRRLQKISFSKFAPKRPLLRRVQLLLATASAFRGLCSAGCGFVP